MLIEMLRAPDGATIADITKAMQDAAFGLIAAGTLAKIYLPGRPGGAGPEGWLTQSKTSPALYLNTEAVILEGPHARRRIYTRIGFKGKSLNERGEGVGNRARIYRNRIFSAG